MIIILTPEKFEEFVRLLDAPFRDLSKLKKTLSTPSPFEK